MIDISKYDACYIVAGGPSLKDFDWTLLDNKFVIAINNSYQVLPNAQIVYFTDDLWWKEHKEKVLNHTGIKCKGSLLNRFIKHPKVKEYLLTGPNHLESTPGSLRHGHNSTYAAINLSVQLGFKKIYLLGVDMKWGTPKDKNTSHWHKDHKRKDPESVYKKMMECYATIVEPLKKLGVQVINVNPNSALNVFPKIAFSDLFENYIAPEPKLIVEEPKLLGDKVEKALNTIGGKQVAKVIQKVTKKPCNCGRRKEILNNLHKKLTKQATPIKIERMVKENKPRQAVKPRILPKAPQKK